MNLLLDTHVFFWWLTNDANLSSRAESEIRDNKNIVFVSAVSAWEVAIKVHIGKWPEAEELARNFVENVTAEQFQPLSVTVAHAQHAGLLEFEHKDPFDRLLAAQSKIEKIVLVTADRVFSRMDVETIW